MGNKKTLLLMVLALVLLIGGASVLYDRLGSGLETDQLMIDATQPQTTPSTQPPSTQPPETEPPATQPPATQPPATRETEPAYSTAPDFQVYDAQGKGVLLSDYFGKPIVLNFWASWCGPCQMEMPHFHEKYLELGEQVTFLMVNMTGGRETLESAADFIQSHGYAFPVFYDTQADAALTYSVYSLPTTYFINAQGQLVAHAVGAIDGATLQKGIDMIS